MPQDGPCHRGAGKGMQGASHISGWLPINRSTMGSGEAQGSSRTFWWLPIRRCGMGQQAAGIEGSRGPGSQGRVHAVLCPQQLHLYA